MRKAAALARMLPNLDLKYTVYYESIKRKLKIRCIGVSV